MLGVVVFSVVPDAVALGGGLSVAGGSVFTGFNVYGVVVSDGGAELFGVAVGEFV